MLLTEAQCRRAVSLPDVWALWKHTDRPRVVRLFLQGSGSPPTKTQRPELRSSALQSQLIQSVKGETQFRRRLFSPAGKNVLS